MVAIFVALMFVCLVLTDLGVAKWQAWQVTHTARARRPAAEVMANGIGVWCEVPENVHLNDHHTWFKPDPTGGLEIGADALIARAVGAVRRVILPKAGDQVTAGQPLLRLEHNGCSVTIPSAITGRVITVNNRLIDQPEILSSDPYGNGWICRVSPTHWEDAAPSVRFGEQASMWLEKEFARFQEFISAQVAPDLTLGATSQDGGIPTVGCLGETRAGNLDRLRDGFPSQAIVTLKLRFISGTAGAVPLRIDGGQPHDPK